MSERSEYVAGVFDTLATDYANSRFAYPAAVARRLREASPAGQSIVDCGCGPGLLTKSLLGEFFTVCAVDLSGSMLRTAKTRGGAGRLLAIRGRGEELPIQNDSVGCVVCSQSLHWMDEPSVLRESRRVLTTNGTFAITYQVGMPDDAPCERIYQSELEQAFGSFSDLPTGLRSMKQGVPLLRSDEAHFHTWEIERSHSPAQLAAFFLSRSHTGRADAAIRSHLRNRFDVRLRGELGESIPYSVTVHLAIWPREALG